MANENIGDMATASPMQRVMRVDPKKPWLAALLGLIFVGLGLAYVGKWGYAVLLFIVTIVISLFTMGLAAPVFWAISVYWSWSEAKKYNERAGY